MLNFYNGYVSINIWLSMYGLNWFNSTSKWKLVALLLAEPNILQIETQKHV